MEAFIIDVMDAEVVAHLLHLGLNVLECVAQGVGIEGGVVVYFQFVRNVWRHVGLIGAERRKRIEQNHEAQDDEVGPSCYVALLLHPTFFTSSSQWSIRWRAMDNFSGMWGRWSQSNQDPFDSSERCR